MSNIKISNLETISNILGSEFVVLDDTITTKKATINTVTTAVVRTLSSNAAYTSSIFTTSNSTINLSLSDSYSYIRLTSTTPITINIPALSWSIGTTIAFRRATLASTIAFNTDSGVVINDNGVAGASQGGVFTLKYIDTNTWDYI
jgi:hypothetical protein